MGYLKTILCLANSDKFGGYCVAGKEWIDGETCDWLRPVSSRPGEEISFREQRFEDGTMPKPLDIVEMSMRKHKPHLHQIENHLIDDQFRWKKIGTARWEDLEEMLDDVEGPLWINGYSSSHGINDELPEGRLKELGSSLYLIRPDNLRIIVAREVGGRYPAKTKVRASFSHSGHQYKFVVTDPVIKRKYMTRINQTFDVDEAIICVSLGEVLRSRRCAYKLVATVFAPDMDN